MDCLREIWRASASDSKGVAAPSCTKDCSIRTSSASLAWVHLRALACSCRSSLGHSSPVSASTQASRATAAAGMSSHTSSARLRRAASTCNRCSGQWGAMPFALSSAMSLVAKNFTSSGRCLTAASAHKELDTLTASNSLAAAAALLPRTSKALGLR